MSSFGKDGSSIDAVKSASDYKRQIVPHAELRDVSHFKFLLNWWEQVNQEKQRLPSRKDFNPADFQTILPNIALFDVSYGDGGIADFTVALIGTELANIYGEATGETVSTFDNEYVVQTVLTIGRECLIKREPIGVISEAATVELPFLRSFALYCPLATDHSQIDKLLVQVSFESNK